MSSEKTINILYIDDDEANRELVGFILEQKECWEMIEAESGTEGLKKATAEQPDIILLDISLPDLDGYQVLKRLKNDQRTASIPVIAVSGNTTANDVSLAVKRGFTSYLTKPIELMKFYESIEKALA